MKRTLTALCLIMLTALVFTSCSSSDNSTPPVTDDTTGGTDDSDNDSSDGTDDTVEPDGVLRLVRRDLFEVSNGLIRIDSIKYNEDALILSFETDLLGMGSGEVQVTGFVYEDGKVTRVTRNGTTIATYQYEGDIIVSRLSGGLRTEYAYDDLGYLMTATTYSGTVVDCIDSSEFVDGNRITWDYSCNGQNFTHTFDSGSSPFYVIYTKAINRIFGESINNITESYELVDDETITFTNTYDSDGNLIRRQWSDGAFDYTYEYHYDFVN